MRAERSEAIKLRLQGKSYGEIQSLLKVPKSTLSGWLSTIVLSSTAQGRINERTRKKSLEGLLKLNRQQTTKAIKRARSIQKEATSKINTLSRENLLFVGIALYWAEGYKRLIIKNGRVRTFHPISMTNSDPELIRIFVRFLREICEVPTRKIKASLRLYKHINEENALRYWSSKTAIPFENFGKTYYGISRASLGKRPFNRLPYGTIQARVADTALFHRIIGWIEGLKNK